MSHWLIAVRAVLRAPRVIEEELPSLLAVPASGTHRAAASDAEKTVFLAHRMIARLGRLRRFSANRWRATCLYRSVAECLVLRELGYAAHLLIGARLDPSSDSIAAHAWVECDGIAVQSTRGEAGYEVLNASSAVSAVR